MTSRVKAAPIRESRVRLRQVQGENGLIDLAGEEEHA